MADVAVAGTGTDRNEDDVLADDTLSGVDERGSLDIRTKALQHVVERVVLETPGTVAHASTLGRIRGAYTPKAEITRQGRAARVAVDVACVWPCRVADIATAVRDGVRAEASRMTGVHLVSVDVTIRALSASDLDQGERRRVE